MNKISFFALVTILAPLVLTAQTNYLKISKDIRLPKDSVEGARLIADLDSFLITAQQENIDNKWILPSEKSEMDIILGEIKDICNKQKNNDSLKPHLTNVIPIDNNQYLIQLSYLGKKSNEPYLHASFEIIATSNNNAFLFSSLLAKNTNTWKTKREDYLTVYYQDTNENFIAEYIKFVQEFDAKLTITTPTTFYFCNDCETLAQLLQLTGIQYQLDYNGMTWIMTSFDTPEKNINLYTKRFFYQKTVDPHDIFHSRAAIAVPESKRNHFMICGCSYVYGGSWGISWYDIQKMFKSRMPYNNKTDWLKLYFERYNFGESKEKHLLITQFVNALIIQKIEKEQGFSGVMQLLASGNMYKDRLKFFKTLEEVTGINEKNFNRIIGMMINDAMKNI